MRENHWEEEYEWIAAENTSLKAMCRIDEFPWGQRYMWENGRDHGKFNFIRLLDRTLTDAELSVIVKEQKSFFDDSSFTLNVKISDSVFSKLPEFMNGWATAGTPLVSILIRRNSLPPLPARAGVSIARCETSDDLEKFIEVNASGRDWPVDRDVYNVVRRSFQKQGMNAEYYLLSVDDRPACSANVKRFGDKFNLALLATHKDFQRLGLMNYVTLWLSEELARDFYVQVNRDEPSYLYYSNLPGAEIVNTEVKYVEPR